MKATHMLRVSACLAASCLLLPATAQGQCPSDWLPGQAIPGVDGSVAAATAWNPPVPGLALLVVGGSFEFAGDVVTNNIAAWDGSSWQPLGSGLRGTHAHVYALTVYNGDLIAAGAFSKAGDVRANNIARWDGSEWQALGGDVYGAVYALAIYNGELIAGGSFGWAGGVSASRIARWNGSI